MPSSCYLCLWCCWCLAAYDVAAVVGITTGVTGLWGPLLLQGLPGSHVPQLWLVGGWDWGRSQSHGHLYHVQVCWVCRCCWYWWGGWHCVHLCSWGRVLGSWSLLSFLPGSFWVCHGLGPPAMHSAFPVSPLLSRGGWSGNAPARGAGFAGTQGLHAAPTAGRDRVRSAAAGGWVTSAAAASEASGHRFHLPLLGEGKRLRSNCQCGSWSLWSLAPAQFLESQVTSTTTTSGSVRVLDAAPMLKGLVLEVTLLGETKGAGSQILSLFPWVSSHEPTVIPGTSRSVGCLDSWGLHSWSFLGPLVSSVTTVHGTSGLGSYCHCSPVCTMSLSSSPSTFRCIDLSGIQVCYAESPVLVDGYPTGFNLEGRDKGKNSLWHDADVSSPKCKFENKTFGKLFLCAALQSLTALTLCLILV